MATQSTEAVMLRSSGVLSFVSMSENINTHSSMVVTLQVHPHHDCRSTLPLTMIQQISFQMKPTRTFGCARPMVSRRNTYKMRGV